MTAGVETVEHAPGHDPTAVDDERAEGATRTLLRSIRGAATPSRAGAPRLAIVVLSVAAVAYWLDRASGVWFPGDDWYLLAGRALDSDGLLEQHAGHLVALPVIVYRILYWAFGVRSYTPYLLVTIALHLAIAWQLRAVMLRAKVDEWVAVAFTAIWLFFGPGATNVVYAFQMTLAGSLCLGLVHLRLADHDGRSRFRDAIGALAGVGAVACSGVGVAMVAAVGAAVLIRRGWRAAAMHVGPAAVLYSAWSGSAWADSDTTYPRTARVWVRWVSESLRGAVAEIGGSAVLAIVLAVVLVAGVALLVHDGIASEARRRLAAPVGLAVGAVGVSVLTASRAWLGFGQASASRYVAVVAPLLLPILAAATQRTLEVADRYRVAGRASIAGLAVVAVVANLGAGPAAPRTSLREAFASVPRHPLAAATPAGLAPAPTVAPAVTLGWLRSALAAGRLPGAPSRTPERDATAVLRLSVRQRAADTSTLRRLGIGRDARAPLDVASNPRCRPLTRSTTLTLRPDRPVVLFGAAMIRSLPPTVAVPSQALPFGTVLVYTLPGPKQLDAVARPIVLQVFAGRGTWCE